MSAKLLRTSGVRTSIRGLWIALLLCSNLAIAYPEAAAAATDTRGAAIRIIETHDHSMVLELRVDAFNFETVQSDDLMAAAVTIPGTLLTADPGLPRLPALGTMLALPTAHGVAMEILETEIELLEDVEIDNAPQFTVGQGVVVRSSGRYLIDPYTTASVEYAEDAFFPAAAVELGPAGVMRRQSVVQLQFYPLAYNPVTRMARLYRRTVVRLSWDASAATPMAAGASAAFEPIYRETVLNYAAMAAVQASGSARQVVPAPGAATSPPLLGRRIRVQEPGVYAVNLTALGLDGARTSVWSQGEQVKRLIRTQGDVTTLYFYGAPLNSHYVGDNVYWLRDDLPVEAETDRIATQPERTSDRIPVVIHYEENNVYWQNMRGQTRVSSDLERRGICASDEDPELCLDRWFWAEPLAGGSSWSRTLELPAPLLRESGQLLALTLKGFTRASHTARVTVRDGDTGAMIAGPVDITWWGQTLKTAALPINAPGGSVLPRRLEIVIDRAAADPDSKILVDRFALQVVRRFEATAAGMQFEANQGIVAEVDAARDFYLVELASGEAWAPVRRIDQIAQGDPRDLEPGTSYFLALATPLSTCSDNVAPERACVVDTLSYSGAAWLGEKEGEPFEFQLAAQEASYVIITPQSLIAQARELGEIHRARLQPRSCGDIACPQQGAGVQVVTMEEIANTFGFGISEPHAIREFVQAAMESWNTEYVVLFGDATLDYHGRFSPDDANFGSNLVPTASFESNYFGEIATDNWYGQLSDGAETDPYQDVIIGRIPVNDVSQANAYLAKLRAYPVQAELEPWQKTVLFVNDDEAKFWQTQQRIAGYVPQYELAGTNGKLIEVDARATEGTGAESSVNEVQARIEDVLNQRGAVLLNYLGHGDFDAWGRWDKPDADNPDARENKFIFSLQGEQGATLQNADRQPFVTVGNCLNGAFAGPTGRAALAEQLVVGSGEVGAIGMWAPTGLGYPSGHELLLTEFYRQVFRQPDVTVGSATVTSINRAFVANRFWRELGDMYVLFGDPALSLPISNPPMLTDATMSWTNPATGVTEDLDAAAGLPDEMPIDTTVILTLTREITPSVAFIAAETQWTRRGTRVGRRLRNGAFLYTYMVTVDDPRSPQRETLQHETTYAVRVFTGDGNYDPNQIYDPNEDDGAVSGLFDNSANARTPRWSMRTSGDGSVPGVRAPADSAANRCAPLHIEFNKPIRRISLELQIDPPVPLSPVVWNENGASALVWPLQSFGTSDIYNLSILHAEDYAGNVIADSPIYLQFQIRSEKEACTYLPLLR